MAPKEKKIKKKKAASGKKKAREEMEALAAKEAEAARQELARVTLRERRAREEGYAAVNAAALNAEWVQRMRRAKLEELRGDASALAREHDRRVDHSDRLVEGLVEELRVAGDQHDAAAGAHLHVLDQLLDLQEERLQGVQARFAADLRSIQQEFESEKAEMAAMHARQRKDALDVVAALEAAYAEAVQEASSAYQLAHDEVKGRYSEEYNVLKLTLEQKAAGLEGQVEAQHQAYVSATRAHEASFTELSKSDGEMARTIAAQTHRLRQLQETLAQWRGRIVHNSREWERNNVALAREKEAMMGRHSALKAALARFCQAQEARLRQICASSAAVQASLQERLELAGRILKMAELCRKYELPEDATTEAGGTPAGAGGEPGCSNPGSERGESNGGGGGGCGCQEGVGAGAGPGKACGGACSDSGAASEMPPPERPELAAFFQRINKVYLSSAALGQQRLRLATENAALRAVLRKVEEGATVTQDVLDDPLNTLVVVNSRLQRALRASGSPAAAAARAGSPAPA